MKLLLASLILIVLAACSGTPTTPAQTVYQVEADYNAAAQVVLAYKALPACGTLDTSGTRIVLCSDPAVVAKLKAADTVAYNALVAAENTARSPNAGANAATATLAAQQALQALTTITATLNVKVAP